MIDRALFAAVLLAVASPVLAAGQITAGQFLARAEPLLKKNKMALMFSGEARKLVGILGQAAQNNRARLEADKAAGRAVDTCLPGKGKARVNANDLLAHIRAMPPAQKAQSFDAAFASYTAKKYPCRA
jgi:hypothetical protein